MSTHSTPSHDASSGAAHVGAHPTPFARLVRLLSAERTELGSVLIYAIGVGLVSLATPIAVAALVNTITFGMVLQPIVVLAFLVFLGLCFEGTMDLFQLWLVELIQRRVFVRVATDLAHRLPAVRLDAVDGTNRPELVNRFFDVMTVQKTFATVLTDGLAAFMQIGIGLLVLAFYHPALLALDIVIILATNLFIFLPLRRGVRTAFDESQAKYEVAAWLEELARAPSGVSGFGWRRARELESRCADSQVPRRAQAALHGDLRADHQRPDGAGGGERRAARLRRLPRPSPVAHPRPADRRRADRRGRHQQHHQVRQDPRGGVRPGRRLEQGRAPRRSRSRGAHRRDAAAATAPRRALRVAGVYFAVERARQQWSQALGRARGRVAALGAIVGTHDTELAELLSGVRKATHGSIELGGVDVRRANSCALHDEVVLVRVDDLFAGTVMENVSLTRPGITPTEVRSAIERVGLDDDIRSLPDGYDTVLGPLGAPLSPSQGLRLVIARALAASPRLIIVDDTLDGLRPRLPRARRRGAHEAGLPVDAGRARQRPRLVARASLLRGERPELALP